MTLSALAIIFISLLVACHSFRTVSDDLLNNCGATATGPCEFVQMNSGREGGALITANPAPCAVATNHKHALISDYRGVSVRNVDDLGNDLGGNSRLDLACPGHIISPVLFGGQYFFTVNSAVSRSTYNPSCFCQQTGNCKTRVLEFKSSSGSTWRTAQPLLSQIGVPAINNFESDVIDAPVFVFTCVGDPSSWKWLTANQTSNQPILLSYLSATDAGCPTDFVNSIEKWATVAGYLALMQTAIATPGYRTLGNSIDANDLASLVLEQNDGIALVNELTAGHNVSVSFGPSFLSDTVLATPSDLPPGLGRVDPDTANLVRDTSQFQVAAALIPEVAFGGRDDVLWAVGLDGHLSTTARIDMTDPLAPAYNIFKGTNVFEDLNAACPLLDASNALWNGTGNFPLGCPSVIPSAVPFPIGFYGAQRDKSYTFFSEGGSTFAFLAYATGFPCRYCFSLNKSNTWANVDLWDVTSNPSLVQRYTYNRLLPARNLFKHVYLFGNVFYGNSSETQDRIWWHAVSGTNFNPDMNSKYIDTTVGSDAAIFEIRAVGDLLAVNYGKWGTRFYTVDSSGISGLWRSVDSGFPTTAGIPAGSGSIQSCGTSDIYIRASGPQQTAVASAGLYDYIVLEAFDLYNNSVFVTTSSTTTTLSTVTTTVTTGTTTGSAGTTTGTTTSTTTTTTTTTGTTSGNLSPSAPPLASPSVVPSASAIPPPPPCPETCMYDCTYIEPSKLPKPSVKPSKQPAGSKVPEPSFFIIELTYESTAADCGPDCCEVREWLGDDTVAASFYMCSEDSQTKGRAPEYDDKAGTCSIFLAAQEGSDPGQISQAEFDAAVATLEGNFATLCTDAKNCDASTQSGKSADYIIGGGAGSVVASVLLVIAAVATVV